MAVEYAGLGTVEDSGAPEIKLDAVLRDAEREVKKVAPRPTAGFADVAAEEEYISAASDAEMRVFDYLVNTEGYLSSSGVSGISESYVDFARVEAIVRRAMSGVSNSASSNKLRSIPIARG